MNSSSSSRVGRVAASALAATALFCSLSIAMPGALRGQSRAVAAGDSCFQRVYQFQSDPVSWLAFLTDRDTELRKAIFEPITGKMWLTGSKKITLGAGDPSPHNRVDTVLCDAETGWAIVEYHLLRRIDILDWDGQPEDTSVFSTPGSNGPAAGQAGPATVQTVVGYADNGGSTPYHAFRWTEAQGVVDLGTLDPANSSTRSSRATAVSHDGSIVVGYSDIAGGATQHAFRWTAAAGMVDLGAPAGPSRASRALDVSGGGDVIVGEADFLDPAAFTGIRSGAFRWTAAAGFQSLGALEPGFFTRASAASEDGSVVVGEGGIGLVIGNVGVNGSRAFRWSTGGGLATIGSLPGHRFAAATDVSYDGGVVVGTSMPDGGSSAAFRWTAATGIRDLRQLLQDAGLNLAGIQLVTATSVSGDGQWIVGEMKVAGTPENETESFLVRFCDAAVAQPCQAFALPTPNFSIDLPNGSELTTAAGSSASATLTVTPQNGFNQAVGFECSDLPTGADCSFSPATLTPADNAIGTTLTVTTTGSAQTPGPRRERLPRVPLGALLAIGALCMAGSVTGQASRWRRAVPRFCAAIAVATLGACGDSGPAAPSPTPAGTYEVTVKATGGSGASALEKTTTLTLTVTP